MLLLGTAQVLTVFIVTLQGRRNCCQDSMWLLRFLSLKVFRVCCFAAAGQGTFAVCWIRGLETIP